MFRHWWKPLVWLKLAQHGKEAAFVFSLFDDWGLHCGKAANKSPCVAHFSFSYPHNGSCSTSCGSLHGEENVKTPGNLHDGLVLKTNVPGNTHVASSVKQQPSSHEKTKKIMSVVLSGSKINSAPVGVGSPSSVSFPASTTSYHSWHLRFSCETPQPRGLPHSVVSHHIMDLAFIHIHLDLKLTICSSVLVSLFRNQNAGRSVHWKRVQRTTSILLSFNLSQSRSLLRHRRFCGASQDKKVFFHARTCCQRVFEVVANCMKNSPLSGFMQF